ncbi:unnamed protein product, partial [Heterosigma akashiwo]
VVGFQALRERAEHQHAHAAELQAYVARLRDTLGTLEAAAARGEAGVRQGMLRHRRLQNRFLQLLRKLEVIRAMGLPLQ